MNRIPIEEIEKMSSKQISEYISEITQTVICRDKKYCEELVKIFRNKPFNS